MDEFLDDFSRKKDQEIVDYNNDWFKEVTKAEKVAGEITGKWKAHLYLKKMRISTLQKSQVLTGALGKFTVEALQKSAMITVPSIKDLQSSRISDEDPGLPMGISPRVAQSIRVKGLATRERAMAHMSQMEAKLRMMLKMIPPVMTRTKILSLSVE